ncbi:mannose-binding protein A-like isoform X3 [Denticeps clupeoides]|uniref:mannose-binding protein A-like isoform X3 n=1 Tax=Denticeps clupeoides TaxID=299321 RepID=UPI0010A393C1|nr:mannose-binding protein A-like isoform X3 [Denticeps clupeoides]
MDFQAEMDHQVSREKREIQDCQSRGLQEKWVPLGRWVQEAPKARRERGVHLSAHKTYRTFLPGIETPFKDLQLEIQRLRSRLSIVETAMRFQVFRKVGQKYYVSDGQVGNFDEVLTFCRHVGGTVVLPTSEEENKALWRLLSALTKSQHAFIGATDKKSEGLFVDMDNRPLMFSKWAKHEPNGASGDEDCTTIGPCEQWYDFSCHSRHIIVCEISEIK